MLYPDEEGTEWFGFTMVELVNFASHLSAVLIEFLRILFLSAPIYYGSLLLPLTMT